MKKILFLSLALGGCQSSSANWAAVSSVTGAIVGAAARYECAKLSPDVALDLLCEDASGAVITAAQARVKGILATKRITKG